MSDYDVDLDLGRPGRRRRSHGHRLRGHDPDPVDAYDDGSLDGDTVEFDDGTTVTSPHQDALGYVYKSTDDWVAGTDKYVVE